MAYVRTVKTASGATAVQIVHSSRKGSRDIEHIGPAHDDAQLEQLKAAARQRQAAGQGEFDLGLDATGPARLVGRWRSRPRGWGMRCRMPTTPSASIPPPTATRCSAAWCWHESSNQPASSTPCGSSKRSASETDTGDGFRESGLSKERRLEPQITVGLLTDAAGFPLMVNAFEGNKAETLTMLPTIKAFMAAAHRLRDVVIVADAGMIAEKSMKEIEAEGLWFILGMRIPKFRT